MQGACIAQGQTFRVDIESFGKKVTNDYRLEVFRRLEVIPFDSQVRLKACAWSCAAGMVAHAMCFEIQCTG
jgi:hypothetical protein